MRRSDSSQHQRPGRAEAKRKVVEIGVYLMDSLFNQYSFLFFFLTDILTNTVYVMIGNSKKGRRIIKCLMLASSLGVYALMQVYVYLSDRGLDSWMDRCVGKCWWCWCRPVEPASRQPKHFGTRCRSLVLQIVLLFALPISQCLLWLWLVLVLVSVSVLVLLVLL